MEKENIPIHSIAREWVECKTYLCGWKGRWGDVQVELFQGHAEIKVCPKCKGHEFTWNIEKVKRYETLNYQAVQVLSFWYHLVEDKSIIDTLIHDITKYPDYLYWHPLVVNLDMELLSGFNIFKVLQQLKRPLIYVFEEDLINEL